MKLNLSFYCFLLSGAVGAAHAASTDYSTSTSLPISRYLSFFDEQDSLSQIQAQSQLTVTPGSTYTTVRAIRVITYTSTDGSCGTELGTDTIDNGAGVMVTLTSGHNYLSTDASNFAFKSAAGSFTPARDTKYQLLDNSLSALGSQSGCITGGGTCNGSTNCGWSASRSWAP